MKNDDDDRDDGKGKNGKEKEIKHGKGGNVILQLNPAKMDPQVMNISLHMLYLSLCKSKLLITQIDYNKKFANTR